MRRSALLLTAFIVAGCAGGLDHRSVTVDGTVRTYELHVPEQLPASPPLVLAFHGGGGTGRNMARMSGFNELADAEGFVVAYPDGWGRHWDDGREIAPSAEEGLDDVAFVDALIAELQADWNIDPSRIFSTGISNGGFFSERLACERSSVFAAVANVAATMPEDLVCEPTEPVAHLWIPGTDDPLVPYEGGMVGRDRGIAVSVDAMVDFWVDANGCIADPVVDDRPDLVDDQTTVRSTTWEDCATELIDVEGGGHAWPGGRGALPELLVGITSDELDASVEIWQFFEQRGARSSGR